MFESRKQYHYFVLFLIIVSFVYTGHFSLFVAFPTFDSKEPVESSFTYDSIPVSQILTVLSLDPEITRLPSGENATDVT
jgi:hypothetical protein